MRLEVDVHRAVGVVQTSPAGPIAQDANLSADTVGAGRAELKAVDAQQQRHPTVALYPDTGQRDRLIEPLYGKITTQPGCCMVGSFPPTR